jgi:hypothetical protein
MVVADHELDLLGVVGHGLCQGIAEILTHQVGHER